MPEERLMKRAIELAERGRGKVSPNPLVGAVIVKDGTILAEGWHERYGGLHAERHALSRCGEPTRGAEMYVTLEPCCHYGKQPPCTEAIIAAGIRRVVIGSNDPNPLVAGKGAEQLCRSGIEVVSGFMKKDCDALNPVFFYYIRTGRPYVVLKYAMTMDGKIAAYTGRSKWITSEETRAYTRRRRGMYRAILVGVGTVKADDPMLTGRSEGVNDPIRIICDSGLHTPPAARVVQTAGECPTWIATCVKDERAYAPYRQKGCCVICVGERDGHVDLVELMDRLGAEGIDSLLLEGGGTLNESALRSGIVCRVEAYVAPKLLGGAGALSPVEGCGAADPKGAVRLCNTRVRMIGEDLMIESDVSGCLRES